MNTTDTDLEAMIERWGKAGLKVRLGGDGIELRVHPGTDWLHAVKMREADYLLYCASATPACRALMESLTALKLPDGYVYVLFRCGDFERLYPTPAATILNGGEAIVIPITDGQPDYELQTGPDLPDVAEITQGQKAALMEDLASVFDPANAKAATEPKPEKKPKGKKQQFPEEYPPGVPCEPWAKETPPILGFTWHSKMWKDMNAYSRIVVFMGQMQMLAKIMAGHTAKTPRWDIDDPFFASRKYVHTICKCSQRTVERVWQKLIKAHVLTRVPGTGKTGETSHWYFHGLGFPGKPKITTAGAQAVTPVGDTDVAK